MARFTAIPVPQGDAFYLQRDDLSVLVDGGRSRSGFPSMFQSATHADGVNILVCTHNDADHARGILGFLEAGLRCDEVWLPGRWLATLPDVLKPFVEVFLELAGELSESADLPEPEALSSGLSPIEAYSERLAEVKDRNSRVDEVLIADDGWPEPYIRPLELAEPWGPFPSGSFLPLYPLPFLPHFFPEIDFGPAETHLLWSAIDAANQIRAIAIEAFHRGIPVRWFEFDSHSASGGLPALQPVNARAIARVRPRVGRLLDYLALTVSNKESLAFWSPPTDQHQGVLFTADSDLAGVALPDRLRGALATAPHHGSDANANAYESVQSAAGEDFSTITWVRSDGRYRNRPGSAYLGLSSRRLCTLCRLGPGGSTPKQGVHLFSRGAVWTRHPKSRICSCR